MSFRLVLAALALPVVLAWSGATAHAQPARPTDAPSEEELLAARQLFEDAIKREEAEDWAGALAILERVAQVRLSPNVRYHIALCHEWLGRLVEAVNGYELAAQEAKNAGKEAAKVAANAPKRAAELRKQLGQIEIVVTGELRTSRVLLDGKNVLRALLGSALPVNPGAHTIELETGGKVVTERAVTLEKGGLERVELEVHDPEPPPDPVPQPQPLPKPGTPEPDTGEGAGRIAAYVVGSVGLASLATSAILWGLRENAIAEVRASCDANDGHCDPALQPTEDQAYTFQNVSFALLGVGAASLTTGIVLFFALPPDEEPSDGDEPAPAPSPEVTLRAAPFGLRLDGRF
ncbi:MAG: hypothetical protein IT373_21620 [Polyangiaceae bacterium]|nr:hypothetical protein [Polyangiaceae bacterium]